MRRFPRLDRTAYRPQLRTLAVLGAVYALFWLLLAIDPFNRRDWLMENLLVIGFAAGLWLSARHFVFSRISYVLIFAFLVLHAIGAHYTYAQVPYDDAWRALTGHGFNEIFGWNRNYYDRLVHFSYGLLLSYPERELFLRVADARGFWGYFLPFDFTMSTSAIYELIEWAAAATVGKDLGAAYLGTQGDIWDAQKDMLMAGLGALTAMFVTLAVNRSQQRDFARDWGQSLRVKDPRPLDAQPPDRNSAGAGGS